MWNGVLGIVTEGAGACGLALYVWLGATIASSFQTCPRGRIRMSALYVCSPLEVQDMGCVMRLELLDVRNPEKCWLSPIWLGSVCSCVWLMVIYHLSLCLCKTWGGSVCETGPLLSLSHRDEKYVTVLCQSCQGGGCLLQRSLVQPPWWQLSCHWVAPKLRLNPAWIRPRIETTVFWDGGYLDTEKVSTNFPPDHQRLLLLLTF